MGMISFLKYMNLDRNPFSDIDFKKQFKKVITQIRFVEAIKG